MHAPAIHVYHQKGVAWVSISMHVCDPFPIVMGHPVAALRAAGAPLIGSLRKSLRLALIRLPEENFPKDVTLGMYVGCIQP